MCSSAYCWPVSSLGRLWGLRQWRHHVWMLGSVVVICVAAANQLAVRGGEWESSSNQPVELGRFIDWRLEIGKIGTHQKVGESDVCTIRFRFHAACHNSTAHGEHLATTVTRARCRKQTGEEGVRGGSAVGQLTSLIFASYCRSFDVYSGRFCAAYAKSN